MNFNQKIYQAVKKIPRGKVASYGQIAALVDSPRSARAVGWAMHALDNHNSSRVEFTSRGETHRKGEVAKSRQVGTSVGRGKHPTRASPSKGYPWWRVINSKGFISTTCEEHTYELQKKLLEKDGVEVKWHDKKQMYHIDMNEYLWLPKI
jgi:alkylated DNA nucleotide flippase Atl1